VALLQLAVRVAYLLEQAGAGDRNYELAVDDQQGEFG
jgi:hypothetical protein